MIDIDDIINKLEIEYDKQYHIAIEYKAMLDYHSYLEDAAEYLKMLKPIMEIAAKDNGKSATKSFEYMQQIKEHIKHLKNISEYANDFNCSLEQAKNELEVRKKTN